MSVRVEQALLPGDVITLDMLHNKCGGKYKALNNTLAEVVKHVPEHGSRGGWRVFLKTIPYFQGGDGFLHVRPHQIKELSSRMESMDVD